MASVVLQGPALFPLDNDTSGTNARPLWIGTPGLLNGGSAYPFGPLSYAIPTDPVRMRTGVVLRSFFEDYYNRIHFLPRTIDFGAISGEASAVFYVWNAFLVETTVNSITLVNADGLTLDGPATPTLYKPLGFEQYTLTAAEDGPATIAAQLVFETDTSGDLSVAAVNAIGVRSYMSPFAPNWSDPVNVSYEFRTEILTTRTGKEQRRALRNTSRKSIDFTAMLTGDRLRTALRLLTVAQARTMVMPEYPRKATVVGTIAPGAFDVEVESVPYWLIADAPIVLANGTRLEARKVASVAGTTVTLQSASGDAWPLGTMLYASVSGRFASSLTSRRPTNNVAVVDVTFNVTPGSETPAPEPYEPVLFNGREVFELRPNWRETIQLTLSQESDTIDYGQGRIAVYQPVAFSERTWRATFIGRDFDALDAIRAFFERQKGRRGEFYVPTWDNDLIPKIPSVLDSNGIRVAGTEVFDAYRTDTVYRAVCVRMRSGLTIYNRVTSVTAVTDPGGTDSLVTCADSWPVEITAENVIMISWMPACRMASDKATFQWLTSEVGQVQLTVQTIEDLA